jgi:hypothetical protein
MKLSKNAILDFIYVASIILLIIGGALIFGGYNRWPGWGFIIFGTVTCIVQMLFIQTDKK